VDNVIRMRSTAVAVRAAPPSGVSDLIVIGNRWTARDGIANREGGRLTAFDNTVVAAEEIPDVAVAPVPFLKKVDRPVIAVTAGAVAQGIQTAIDAAAKLNGERPVVYLPKGQYALSQTLVIPAGCDMQIVGDGGENGTEIKSAANPAILVKSPSKATFRTLSVHSAGGTGILVEDADCGGMIFGDQVNASGKGFGIEIEGLKNTPVEMRSFGHNGVRVTGGGEGTASWVGFFSGGTSRHTQDHPGIPLWDVQNGGKLLARDFWYEGHSRIMFNLTGSGTFACHSAYMCPYGNDENSPGWEKDVRAKYPSFGIDGFKGTAALTLISSDCGPFAIAPPSPDVRLYLLGYYGDEAGLDLGGDAVKGVVCAEHTRMPLRYPPHPDYPNQSIGTTDIPNEGIASTPEFIREMLAPLRTVKPQPLVPRGKGEQDLRFFRVWLHGETGLKILAPM